MPDFDTEETREDSTVQPAEPLEEPSNQQPEGQPEPTLDELFEQEPTAVESVEEKVEEKTEEQTEEQLQDELFGSDEPSETEAETEAETEPETEPEDTPPSEEPAKEAADDPFDEPSVDQLPSKQLPSESAEQSLDKEIKRRMDELDSNVLEKEIEKEAQEEKESEDPLDIFDKPLDDEPRDDSDTSKLFGDPENLDIEIGGPIPSTRLTEAERQQQLEQLAKERLQSEKNCADEIAKMKSDRIDDIDLSLSLEGNPGEDFPYECSVGYSKYQPRQWAQITYNWKASGLCHKPLYFEQVQLERYGHSWGPYVQPIMSGVHFFGTLPILPYKMGLKTPNECVYTLGYYRPGNCAPYLVGGVPFTWRAALYQGAVTTGLFFAIP